MSSDVHHLDGNATGGELSRIFALDITAALGECAHCGAIKRFADAHVYTRCPGIVARCAVCEHVLLRLVSADHHVLLDMRGVAQLIFDMGPSTAA